MISILFIAFIFYFTIFMYLCFLCIESQYMKRCDNALLEMLAQDLQPLAIVEYPGFMSYINSMGSHAKLPTKHSLLNTLLPAKYADVQKTVLLMLSHAKHIALSGDIWMSPTGENLYITAHFINNEWELKSVALGMIFLLNQCTIDELAERLFQLVEKWQITGKVSCLISSRNTKLSSAAKMRNWSHLCCFADSLNLAVKDSLRANEDLMQLQKACCNLVLLIQSTVISSSNMGTILEQINFPDVKLTHHYWVSLVEMLDCMVAQKLTVAAVLCMMNKNSLTLNPDTVRAIEAALAVLKPIQKFVKEISAKEHTFLSEIVPFVQQLQHIPSTDLSVQLVEELTLQARRRLFSIQHSNLTLVTSLLDPRMKSKPPGAQIPSPSQTASSPNETVSSPKENTSANTTAEGSNTEIKPLLAANVTEDAMSCDGSTMEELGKYLESDVVASSEDPLLWWKKNESAYPRLASLARKYLCIPANAIAPSRIFSPEGESVLDKRNRVEPECIDAMLFLHKNIKY